MSLGCFSQDKGLPFFLKFYSEVENHWSSPRLYAYHITGLTPELPSPPASIRNCRFSPFVDVEHESNQPHPSLTANKLREVIQCRVYMASATFNFLGHVDVVVVVVVILVVKFTAKSSQAIVKSNN